MSGKGAAERHRERRKQRQDAVEAIYRMTGPVETLTFVAKMGWTVRCPECRGKSVRGGAGPSFGEFLKQKKESYFDPDKGKDCVLCQNRGQLHAPLQDWSPHQVIKFNGQTISYAVDLPRAMVLREVRVAKRYPTRKRRT